MKTNLVIPNRSIWSFIGLLLLGTFTWFQIVGYIGPGFLAIKSLNIQTLDNTVSGLVWVPIIAFILTILVLLLSINIFKNIANLENDLLVYIIFGLVFGLVVCITLGLAIGLIGGIIYSFSVSFIGILYGLIQGFLYGLIIGLMVGLVLTIMFLVSPISIKNDIKT